MSPFSTEIRRVQNPAYCSVLIHATTTAYTEAHPEHAPMPLLYAFVVLPILLTPSIRASIKHTAGGLRAAVSKLQSLEGSATDIVLSLNRRARLMRRLTQESVAILLAGNLARLETQSAALFATNSEAVMQRFDLPLELDEAKKLGKWLAPLTPFEVGSTLKVTF